MTNQEMNNSYFAVQEFLQFKGLETKNYNTVECKFSFENPVRSYNHTIEILCKDFITNPSFVLHSDSFKSEGYHKPVWSSYHLFSWDGKKEELSVELNNIKFTIKHI